MSTIEEGMGKAQSHGALSDVRILDLSRVLGGPFVVRSLPTMERTSLRSNRRRGMRPAIGDRPL